MQKKLPKIHHYSPSPVQLNYLSQWLLERELKQNSTSDLEFFSKDWELEPLPNELQHPFDENIQAGQIRLFASDTQRNLNQFLYFAVLKEWDENEWLIAPFSSYSTPALPGELLFQREEIHLRTLCLWNARSVKDLLIRNSWIDSTLTPEEITDALSLFRTQLTGKKLPNSLKDRIGAHVLCSDDPRIEYQQEEITRLNGVQDQKTQHSMPKIKYLSTYFEDIEELMAADDGESIYSKCVILSTDLQDERVEKTTIKQTDFEVNHCDGEYHIHGQWWIETTRKLSGGFVFLDGTLLKEVRVTLEGDGAWIDLSDAVLPKHHSSMKNAARLELVLREDT